MGMHPHLSDPVFPSIKWKLQHLPLGTIVTIGCGNACDLIDVVPGT
jgi:hypothetical protein